MSTSIVNLTQKIVQEEIQTTIDASDAPQHHILQDTDFRDQLMSYVLTHIENLYAPLDQQQREQLDVESLAESMEYRSVIRDRLSEGIRHLQQSEAIEEGINTSADHPPSQRGQASHWFG